MSVVRLSSKKDGRINEMMVKKTMTPLHIMKYFGRNLTRCPRSWTDLKKHEQQQYTLLTILHENSENFNFVKTKPRLLWFYLFLLRLVRKLARSFEPINYKTKRFPRFKQCAWLQFEFSLADDEVNYR